MLLTQPKRMIAALLVLGAVRGAAAQEPAQKTAARLEALWADLASTEEARATRATLKLAANSKDAVPYLKERLKAVKVDAAAVAKLVKQLDSDDYETRESAARELEYLGKFAKAVLEKHVADTESTETKRALRSLIDKIPVDEKTPPPTPKIKGNSVSIRSGGGEIQIFIDGKLLDLTAYAPKPPPAPYMGWIRAARATAVLEHLATTDARQLLEKLADGEPEAPPTKAAKEALERLKKAE